MKRLLKSSKFLAVVLGIVAVLLTHLIGLEPEQVEQAQGMVVVLIGLFVGGTVAEDVALKLKGGKPPKEK